MGRFLTLTKTNSYLPGYKKKTISSSFSIGPVSLKFILITLFSILALFYLTLANQKSTKGYQIRSLEDEKNRLTIENQRLEIEAARLKSLSAIEQTEDLNLVAPKKIDYLPETSEVAVEK